MAALVGHFDVHRSGWKRARRVFCTESEVLKVLMSGFSPSSFIIISVQRCSPKTVCESLVWEGFCVDDIIG